MKYKLVVEAWGDFECYEDASDAARNIDAVVSGQVSDIMLTIWNGSDEKSGQMRKEGKE